VTSDVAADDSSREGRPMINGASDVAPTPSPTPNPCAGLAIHHILVPLDGSAIAERVVPFVTAVAAAFSAHITLLRVLDPADDPRAPIDALEWEMARAEAQTQLGQIEATFHGHGFATTVEIIQGKAAEQIAHFGRTHEADLVVLSSHGAGGLNGWSLGGTVQKLLATTHASVLIVPAQRGGLEPIRFHKILLPLDCSQRAECILPTATELARAHDAQLILAHVVPEPEMPRRMPRSSEDVSLAERVVELNFSEAKRYLADIQRRLSTSGARVDVQIVVSPRRTQTLHELARQEHADLVVLAAHGSTADTKQRYGGVASQFLHEGGEPVIILQDLAEVLHAPGQERPGH